MQTLLYDGSFEGFLCAVFDVYEYRFEDAEIVRKENFNGNIFGKIHEVHLTTEKHERVWKGLQKKLSGEAQEAVHRCFLSEGEGMEKTLLSFFRYVFARNESVEKDFSHPAVLEVMQTAKKVWREKHRMEAFVRFQKTGDGLYYAIIEPDYNVLPLLGDHFTARYADQRWMIYDAGRKYGIYYDLENLSTVSIEFAPDLSEGKNVLPVYDEKEAVFQELWQHYFKHVNIEARRNKKLHLQHMPRRYWKYLPEKKF